jgi:hypothetical protein
MRTWGFILLAACNGASPAIEAAELDAGRSDAGSLPSWPAPELVRMNVEHGVDRLEIRSGARYEVRLALGPTPPRCDRGRAAIVDGDVAELASNESATVCVYDEAGRVRARARSRAFRSVPTMSVFREGQVVFVDQTLAALDDDVGALVYAAFPVSEEDEVQGALPLIGCMTEPGEGDPPQHCTYDCAGGRVVAEVPRAIVERITSSTIFGASHEVDELLYPDTLAVRFPIVLHEGEGLAVCVRTDRGALEADSAMLERPGEPWGECAFEAPGGCPAEAIFEPLEPGDVLYGTDSIGAVSIEAEVRSARVVRGLRRNIEAGPSAYLEVFPDERVLTPAGELPASALTVGMTITRAGRAVEITEIHDRIEDGVRVDLAGATHYRTNGFTIRDAGENEAIDIGRAPPGFRVTIGRGDCALEARLLASAIDDDVAIAVRPWDEQGRFGRASPVCDAPMLTVPAEVTRAVAEIDPRAELAVQLFGDGVVCGDAHVVSVCGAFPEALYAEAAGVCLPAGTMIETERGPRAIEKLLRGDAILSFDEAHGVRAARVLGMTTHDDRELLELVLDDGTRLEATPEHELMAGEARERTAVRALEAGDVLTVRTDDGVEYRTIVAVEPSRRAEVYELRVSAPDTYFANGVLSHNY